jgi:acetyl-CoA carboxylase carboxyltransferase component
MTRCGRLESCRETQSVEAADPRDRFGKKLQQAALKDGRVTSRELVAQYLMRMGLYENKLNAVMTVNANALAEADALDVFSGDPAKQYDMVDLLKCFVDRGSLDEYRAEHGRSLVCAYATINGLACGIVANQRKMTERQMPGGKAGPSKSMNMPAVIYDDSADKAARFILECNQRRVPIVFVNDTTGFMVGRDSEQGGIIRAGAKMVNAMSNCVVPKITLIVGGSFGAGNYAMCGRAFDPFLTLAWPGARCSVMGAAQAAGTLLQIDLAARERKGEKVDEAMRAQLLKAITASYTEQQDIRYAASRGWVDRIIEPAKTREELGFALALAHMAPMDAPLRTGVLQT